MASLLDLIKRLQHTIDKDPKDEDRVLKCIEKLYHLSVTVDHLQETGVGRTVNALRKEPGDVGNAARALVNKWKRMVAEEEKSDSEDHNHDTSHYNGHGNGKDSDNNMHQSRNKGDRHHKDHHSPTKLNDHRHVNGDHSNKKRKHYSSEDESDAKKSRLSQSSDSDGREVKVKKEPSSDSEQDSSSQTDQGSMSEEEVKVKIEPKEEKIIPSHNYKDVVIKKEPNEKSSGKSYHREHSRKEEHKSSKDSSSSKHKSSKEKDSNSSSDKKHKHDKTSDKDRSSSKHSSDRHKSSSHKESEKSSSKNESKHSSPTSKPKNETSKSSSEKDKDKHHSSSSSKEKSKDKDKHDKSSGSSKEKSSHSSSKSDKKHSSSSSRSKSDSSKHKVYNAERGSDKERHKSSSSHKSKSKDVPKKKSQASEDSDDGIDCGSGASFAEALGMVSPTKSKKKFVNSSKDNPISPETCFNNDLSPANLLAPTAKLAPLPALEISALPEISPNYRPRPPPKLLPHVTEEEAISAGISSKNQRTKVYSGNKTYGKIPTLYELCVQVLQEHIDALEYTGGVPYEILKPVVDKATAQQLYVLEHYNPYLMDDTDHLWQNFCEKHFRRQKRLEMETWREMYIRCQEEQEHKLKSLTENIKIAQEAKKAPVKQTKMAYVDSVVKPPRNIARKQALHGTARAVSASPAARVASLAQGVPRPGARAPLPAPSGPLALAGFNKPKKAPLMAKALQFMRGRKR